MEEKEKISLAKKENPVINQESPAVFKDSRIISTHEFEFPCGVINNNGEVCKKFKIKPMTGRVRKKIGEAKVRNNLIKMAKLILEETLVSIEGIDEINESVLNNMLVFDRNYALLALKLASTKQHSRKIITTSQCQNFSCQANMEVEFNIETDFPVTKMPDELNQNIMNIGGLKCRVYKVKDEEYGEIVLRFQSNKDQESIQHLVANNPIEAEHTLMSKLIVGYNGEKLLPDNIDDLDLPTISWIEQNMIKYKFGPELGKTIACYNCGRNNDVEIDLITFLFQSSKSN